MRKLFILVILLLCFVPICVNAEDMTAPVPPDSAMKYMPEDTGSFVEDLLHVITAALSELDPYIKQVYTNCLTLIAITVLVSILQSFSGIAKHTVELVGVLSISMLLFESTNSLLSLGIETVQGLCQYGKLLLPVMATALAAQGGPTTSAALYTGTAFFNSILSSVLISLAIPMIYILLVSGIANNTFENNILKNIKTFIKWLLTWTLKLSIYLFTGYLGITRVITGVTDATAVKATKIAISGMVPVVGKLISDASETILISAGTLKNAAGVYGLLAIVSIFIAPFLRIALQYISLKITASLCSVFGCKSVTQAMDDFSGAMGFLLAITGTICILLFISTVCFMKGVE